MPHAGAGLRPRVLGVQVPRASGFGKAPPRTLPRPPGDRPSTTRLPTVAVTSTAQLLLSHALFALPSAASGQSSPCSCSLSESVLRARKAGRTGRSQGWAHAVCSVEVRCGPMHPGARRSVTVFFTVQMKGLVPPSRLCPYTETRPLRVLPGSPGWPGGSRHQVPWLLSVTSGCSVSGPAAPCARGPAGTEHQEPSCSAGSRQPLKAAAWDRPFWKVRGSGGSYGPGWGQINPRTRLLGFLQSLAAILTIGSLLRATSHCGPAGALGWGLRSSFEASSPNLSLLLSPVPSSWPRPGLCLGPAT